MRKIKVLAVDDAVVVRKIVTSTLGSDPEIEVIATAAYGKIALQNIQQLNPDILMLDIEMPELDGIETLTEARKLYKDLPIICSAILQKEADLKI